MGSFSVVVIVGNLTRDAQLKYTPSGFPIASFSVAVNTKKKQGDAYIDEANFFDVDLFGKTAESLTQYLTKGKMVGIEGELKQDRWEQDGQSRSKVKIVANKIQLLGGGKQDSSTSASGSQRAEAPATPPQGAKAGAGDDFTDDIPF